MFILLKGNHSNKVFGFQIKVFHFTFQYAFKKVGLYNHKTFTWVF